MPSDLLLSTGHCWMDIINFQSDTGNTLAEYPYLDRANRFMYETVFLSTLGVIRCKTEWNAIFNIIF